MGKGKMGLGSIVAVAFGLHASNAHASLYWTPWVSEEQGGPATTCSDWSDSAVGFGCSGRYCDNVRLLCETMPYQTTRDWSTDYWTGYFSEEDDPYATVYSAGWYRYEDKYYRVCHNTSDYAGLVGGIRCSGSYCDNISIECTQAAKWVNGVRYPVNVTNCGWTGWYSEEQGSVDFGYNRYITGVACSGSYCDNKSFYVCSLVDPTP